MQLPSVVEWTHWIVRRVLRSGDVAVDATVGRGRDTLLLAECVGSTGLVIGCDVQECAIDSARQLLAAHGVLERVRLHLASHERIDELCAAEGVRQVRAVMYNLGYLPGGNVRICTQSNSTLASLAKALALLDHGGVITIACYCGHEGGREETDAVLQWASQLDSEQFECVSYIPLTVPDAPLGIAVARRTTR